jgi:hypothetical protein
MESLLLNKGRKLLYNATKVNKKGKHNERQLVYVIVIGAQSEDKLRSMVDKLI